MARPRLLQEELRSKEIKVRFTAAEYEQLLNTMYLCGHDSPAAFLRVSGIRSEVPRKIFVTNTDKELMADIRYAISEIRDELIVRDSSDLKEVASMLAAAVKQMQDKNERFIRYVKQQEERGLKL